VFDAVERTADRLHRLRKKSIFRNRMEVNTSKCA
jgi:hypothetical protein